MQRVVFLSRLVPLLEGLLVAYLLYVLGSRLFGTWAGVLSSALWLTTPVFIGFSHILSIDVSFTLATLAVSLSLLHFLERPSIGRASVVALAVGAALLTRHTALVLLAVALVIVVAKGWRTREERDAQAGGRRRVRVVGRCLAELPAVRLHRRPPAPPAPGSTATSPPDGTTRP